ncbi:hypothetical protein [Roseicyclus persicicus]|uniref:Uncharacterized protein n=1 Tax=Roseicyclus persicicus TaxID=2650661 RepID=A0A7X6JXX5_9RHOB|nr:hypothetical protein [Roseibacterium persicicum]NKX43525.1 hypothetical protein [Roseibacterium persicicum]
MPARLVRPALAALVAAPLLSGCALFGFGPRPAPADPSETVYRAAMEDLSLCITAADPAARVAAAARLAEAAALMQAETRPTNPDHFYMADRVAAGAAFCADEIG